MTAPRSTAELPKLAEVVVIGAGIIGTAIGARLAAGGIEVCLLERFGAASGTSSSGEGNLLVSDKLPGPELELARLGLAYWREVAERAGEEIEYEQKGGLVVASSPDELEALVALASAQAREGVRIERLDKKELRELEPALSPELLGGVLYPQDAQIQPVRAVALHVRELIAAGGRLVTGVEVTGARLDREGRIVELRTTRGEIAVGSAVVNAAGPWAGEVAARLGSALAIEARRGHVLVTEPVPCFLAHKVYEAGYVGSIHHRPGDFECSSVVEATQSGTMLLGSSREFVGFSHTSNLAIVAAIARRAIALVPALAQVRLMRSYVGFRPASPDGLPLIGIDGALGRLVHATGHEGSGIGLAEVTAVLVEAIVSGKPPPLDLAPFAPGRFGAPERSLASSDDAPAPIPVGRPLEQLRAHEEPRPLAASAPKPERVAPVEEQRCSFSFDGRRYSAPAGSSVAGALIANGVRSWRTTRTGGERRGLFCAIGTCFDCLIDLNGARAVRACMATLHDGDALSSSSSLGAAPALETGTTTRVRGQRDGGPDAG